MMESSMILQSYSMRRWNKQNAVDNENFTNFLNILEQLYDTAYTQVIREATPKILGYHSD